MIHSEKKNITTTEVVFIKLLCYNVVSKEKKNKNENTECHGMFITFKSHLNSKQGSLIFLLFGSWSLVRSSSPKCFVKKVFLEISQKSQENSCARFSIIKELQAQGLRPANLSKRDSDTGISCEFCKISRNTSGGCFCLVSYLLVGVKSKFFR